MTSASDQTPPGEGCFLQLEDPASSRSLIVEDDGRVAYAYLLDGKQMIADVWLYNVAPTPDHQDWKDRSQMPFLNPRDYCAAKPSCGCRKTRMSCAIGRTQVSR